MQGWKTRVNGHDVFQSDSRPGDTFTCAREPGNPHSPDVIIVKLSNVSNVGHILDPLVRILVSSTGVTRSAPEGICVHARGIEIACGYALYGVKKDCEM